MAHPERGHMEGKILQRGDKELSGRDILMRCLTTGHILRHASLISVSLHIIKCAYTN